MTATKFHCKTCGIHLPPRLRRFTADVLAERARLALVDPEGERDAAYPLSQEQARRVLRHLSEPVYSHPKPIRSGAPLNERALLDKLGCDPDADHGLVHCPGPLHPRGDRNKSLSWAYRDGKALLKCFAGDDFDSIRAALS